MDSLFCNAKQNRSSFCGWFFYYYFYPQKCNQFSIDFVRSFVGVPAPSTAGMSRRGPNNKKGVENRHQRVSDVVKKKHNNLKVRFYFRFFSFETPWGEVSPWRVHSIGQTKQFSGEKNFRQRRAEPRRGIQPQHTRSYRTNCNSN